MPLEKIEISPFAFKGQIEGVKGCQQVWLFLVPFPEERVVLCIEGCAALSFKWGDDLTVSHLIQAGCGLHNAASVMRLLNDHRDEYQNSIFQKLSVLTNEAEQSPIAGI